MVYVHTTTSLLRVMPESSAGNILSPRRSSVPFGSRNRHVSVTLAATSSSEPTSSDLAPLKQPRIELQFIGPKPEADGKYPLDRAIALSGEKLLRSIMQDSKIELYAPYGKVMNCGGGGTCGTCIVEESIAVRPSGLLDCITRDFSILGPMSRTEEVWSIDGNKD